MCTNPYPWCQALDMPREIEASYKQVALVWDIRTNIKGLTPLIKKQFVKEAKAKNVFFVPTYIFGLIHW